MAYAALVSLSQTIDKLLHHHNDQFSISLPEKQQIISIHEFVIFFQVFLENFPEKANSWEEQMRDVAYEAEDLIEYFMSDEIQQYYVMKSTTGPESVKFPHHQSGLFMWLKRKKSGRSFDSKKWKKVTKSIESIAGAVMKIKNSTGAKHVQVSDFSATASSSKLGKKYMKLRFHFNFKELKRESREVLHPCDSSAATSSSMPITPTNKDAMVGFDDDLMAIKARLCGESSKLQVIPILGMGGIGKTTLARNAYDDLSTVEHFDIRAWVTVSQDYSAQKILSGLLVSMKVDRSERRIESMAQNVYQHLKGRRYLIVMDDMWSTKAWDDVKMVFPDDHNGSRIILTTRLSDVAAYPDSSSTLHEMRFMDADQSWSLLQQKVFPQENFPLELEAIGKTIAVSCRGLPLAIILIAGLLHTISKTPAAWENIAKDVNLAISTTNDKQLAKIQSLSYINLPHHLRPCFLYMGGFPEDYEIQILKLIKLWVAEGFLKLSGSKSFEEEAEEYLEDLVKRSLVMVTRRKSNDKIKICSIHDLVRDFCIRKAQEEKFILNVMDRYVSKNSLKGMNNQRRITIASHNLDCLENTDGSSSTIRTIIFFQLHPISLSSLGNFRLLRVLDVVPDNSEFFIIIILPAEIFELFHLRYLAFTFGFEFSLWPDILNLQNLQTLIIQPRKILDRDDLQVLSVFLPMEIWRMPQLRHLTFVGLLPNIPYGETTFPLENLQTLSGVKNLKCTKEILKMIPSLRTLGIVYLGKGYLEDSHLENLAHMHQLKNLKLEVCSDAFVPSMVNLVFPTMLKELTLSNWGLCWKDMSIVGSLPNLEVLKLKRYACYGDKWETREGEFPQLKFLLIDYFELCQWITESSHFPSLKCLVLYHCYGLNEIPDGIGEISTLELIEVDDWNKSVVESAKRIQEEQQSWGNDALQVRVMDRWRKY